MPSEEMPTNPKAESRKASKPGSSNKSSKNAKTSKEGRHNINVFGVQNIFIVVSNRILLVGKQIYISEWGN